MRNWDYPGHAKMTDHSRPILWLSASGAITTIQFFLYLPHSDHGPSTSCHWGSREQLPYSLCKKKKKAGLKAAELTNTALWIIQITPTLVCSLFPDGWVSSTGPHSVITHFQIAVGRFLICDFKCRLWHAYLVSNKTMLQFILYYILWQYLFRQSSYFLQS